MKPHTEAIIKALTKGRPTLSLYDNETSTVKLNVDCPDTGKPCNNNCRFFKFSSFTNNFNQTLIDITCVKVLGSGLCIQVDD